MKNIAFIISYWPQCITEAVIKERLVEEKAILDWWNNHLSETDKKSLNELHEKLNIDQQYNVNHTFSLIGRDPLSEIPTPADCFYLCYLKNISLTGFDSKNRLRQGIINCLDKTNNNRLFPMITTDIVSSAQLHREALDRQGLGKKFRKFSKNIHESIPAALSLVLLGSAYLTIKQAYHSAKNIFHGKKPLRNLWYIASQAGGGYLGWFIGGLVLSSFFPGLGTLAYLALAAGIAGCACLVRTIIAKPIAQGVSSLSVKLGYYGDEYIAYPPSPDKYRPIAKPDSPVFTQDEQKTMTSNRIAFILGEFKKEKDKKLGFSRHFSTTESSEVTKEFNQKIEQLKTGQMLPNVTYKGKFYKYRWQSNNISDNKIEDKLIIKPYS